jgi:hypothetical protein
LRKNYLRKIEYQRFPCIATSTTSSMKWTLAFTYLILLLAYKNTFAQNKHLQLDSIESYFSNNFTPSFEHQGVFRWEKRNQDWYLVSLEYQNGQYVDKTKTKVVADGKYIDVHEHYRAKTDSNDTFNYQNTNTGYTHYQLQPYYGYNGWYNDVIDYYKQYPPANATSYYALGRAYSSKATGYLGNQFGDAIASEQMELPLGMNCLKPKQISQFLATSEQAQNCFKQSMLLDPNLETIVGKIQIKYANEIITAFHTLLVFADSFAQHYSLPENIYPDSLLHASRLLLQSCPSNSIFVSAGDNDFYPLLYLQQKERLRRDVYVIHFGLLAMDRFILRASYPQFEAKAINLPIKKNLYEQNHNAYINNIQASAEMTMNDLMSTLTYNAGIEDVEKQLPIYGQYLRIDSKAKPQQKIRLKQSQYMYKETWVFWKLLQHLGDRSIVCQYPIPEESYASFNQLLKSKNGLYHFNWQQVK